MTNKRIILQTAIIITIIFIVLTNLANRLPFHRGLFIFFSLYLIVFTGYLISKILFNHLNLLFSAIYSFLFGFITIYFLLFLSALFGFDCTYIKLAVPVINIALAFILHFRPEKSLLREKGSHLANQFGAELHSLHYIIIASLVFVIITIVLTSKDPFIYTSDSNDHVSYIRTISRTHEVFPREFYYKGETVLTRDLRKSLYHGLWGTIEAITKRKEVHEIWPIISAYGSVFFILSLISAVYLIFGRMSIGIISTLLFLLLYHKGLKGYQLITIAYAFPFGKIFYLIFISTVLRYLLERKKEFLLLAALSIAAATMTHIGHLIIGFFTLGSFSLLLLLYRDYSKQRMSIVKASISCAVLTACLTIPYLIFRYANDYHPNNIIHTHIQGIMYFSKNLFVLNPVVFFGAVGYLGVASLICIFLFTKSQKKEISLRLLTHTLIITYILLFNPFWFPLLAKKLSYLLIRFEFAVPAMILPSFLIHSLVTKDVRSGFSRHGTRKIIGWLTVITLLIAPALTTVKSFAYSPKTLSVKRSSGSLGLIDLFTFINENIKEGNVIASDPITSYSIPAFTDQFVICPFDQHSIPNDSTALERISQCRILYDQCAPLDEVRRVMNRYNAKYLVINGRIPPNLQTIFWKPDKESSIKVIRELEKKGPGFKSIYKGQDLTLFELSGNISETQQEGKCRYFVGDTLRDDEWKKLIESGVNGIFIKQVSFSSKKARKGSNIDLTIKWIAINEQPVHGYVAYIRFDTGFKKSSIYLKPIGKIYRKILEKVKGERYRFRIDVQPLKGIYPPYSWPQNREIIDKHTIHIPENIAKGIYRVSIKLDIKTQYPNYSLSDIFSDNDKYSGVEVGEIIIE
ncbi:MAG: hypothetical protein ACXQT5_06010 [Candidatus Syntropharchaeia archaeon]